MAHPPVYEMADPRRNEPGYLLAEREMVEACRPGASCAAS